MKLMGRSKNTLFPPEAGSPWWKHFFWLVPLGIVLGVGLAFWSPPHEHDQKAKNKKQAAKLEPKDSLLPIKPPKTTDNISNQQMQIRAGQKLAATNGMTQLGVTNRNQISTNQYSTYRLPRGLGRNGQRQPVVTRSASILGEPGAPKRDNKIKGDRSLKPNGTLPQTHLDLQVALDRRGFSPGSIDGIAGSQTYAALRAFQESKGFAATGRLDTATRKQLELINPSTQSYLLTTNDFIGLQPVGTGWTEKSRQSELAHETVLERVAERYHCSPNYLKRANPKVDWATLIAGQSLNVPKTEREAQWQITGSAAEIHISLTARTLQAVDDQGKLLAHFPCSIARRVDKRPEGALQITALAPKPDYTYDPENFPSSAEARNGTGKLMIPPGPNNPVGSVWISLNLNGYGIHGTPKPEEIGRTESLGCFRLSNWNAERLLAMVSVGTRVLVEP